MRGVATPPSRIEPTVPPELERIIFRALARDLTQRYGSAGELCADLRALQVALGQQPAQAFGTELHAAHRTLVQTVMPTGQQAGSPPMAMPAPPVQPAPTPRRTLRATLRPATLEPAADDHFGFPGAPSPRRES